MSAHSQPKSSVIIACDVGLKRIGLATLTNGIVLPLEPIIRKNRNQAARDLREVLQMRGVNKLIVGLPLYQHTQDINSQNPQKESQQTSQNHTDSSNAKSGIDFIDSSLDSSTNPTSVRIKHFIGLLDCASMCCEVMYVNEDFSSIIALENLSHTTKSARKKSVKDGRLDSLAACEILRRYLKISDANP
ncbi:Holliday junction resolvase RuvX [Helicobacter sp. MIT 01-3238]|uniref:Holliday junction resolvase RuvX n=1 Tax=Helicobacter sp. MIT 01-3238 TaxID=398627 RepID=UPI000E1EE828